MVCINNANPTFVCGALRSGSTMFHLMLDSHPEIINPGEFDFLFEKMTNDGALPDLDEYVNYLSTNRIFKSKELTINNALSYGELIDSFVRQKSKVGSFLTLNIHRHFDRVFFLYPKAKYIHLLRDPRDVARSSVGMNWAGNVYYGVDHWIETERSWNRLKTRLDDYQYIEIKFEELVSNAEKVLEKVCNFIGVEYSQSMLDYQNNSTYSKPDISLINQWKRKQTPRELQNVESKVGSMMMERGYELSGYPLKSPGFFEKLILALQNKYFKVNMGIKRYGFMLYFLYRLSGKLRLKQWHKSLLLKINEINKKHVK